MTSDIHKDVYLSLKTSWHESSHPNLDSNLHGEGDEEFQVSAPTTPPLKGNSFEKVLMMVTIISYPMTIGYFFWFFFFFF